MSMLLSISHFVQQLFLSLAKIRRQHNVIRNDEITHRTVATVIALATQPYLRTVLRFRLYLQLDLMTTRELQDYLAAEQRRVKVDVYVPAPPNSCSKKLEKPPPSPLKPEKSKPLKGEPSPPPE